MSVIAFGMKEIAEVEGRVFSLAKNHNSAVYYAVRYSKPYQKYSGFETKTNPVLEEDVILEVVARLFWYFSVANKIAYALQYEEEPGIWEEKKPDTKESAFMPLRELRKKLGSFDYNLATNDGNRFLGTDWARLWENVRNAVNEDILNAQERGGE